MSFIEKKLVKIGGSWGFRFSEKDLLDSPSLKYYVYIKNRDIIFTTRQTEYGTEKRRFNRSGKGYMVTIPFRELRVDLDTLNALKLGIIPIYKFEFRDGKIIASITKS